MKRSFDICRESPRRRSIPEVIQGNRDPTIFTVLQLSFLQSPRSTFHSYRLRDAEHRCAERARQCELSRYEIKKIKNVILINCPLIRSILIFQFLIANITPDREESAMKSAKRTLAGTNGLMNMSIANLDCTRVLLLLLLKHHSTHGGKPSVYNHQSLSTVRLFTRELQVARRLSRKWPYPRVRCKNV